MLQKVEHSVKMYQSRKDSHVSIEKPIFTLQKSYHIHVLTCNFIKVDQD